METKKRLLFFDLLKAFAIIAVVLYHLGYLTYGYLGVDIFFVVGGYFAALTLQKRQEKAKSVWLSFVIDKLYRLWLPILLGGALCLAVGYFLMLPDNLENLAESVIASDFFANNVLQEMTTGDYWGVVNDFKPLMHTWYTGLLMQFYIVIPLFFAFGSGEKRRRNAAVLLTVFSVLSFVLYLVPVFSSAYKFYFLPFRFFELGVGALIALNREKIAALSEKTSDRVKGVKTVGRTGAFLICLCGLFVLVFSPVEISGSFALVVTVALTSISVCLYLQICSDGENFPKKAMPFLRSVAFIGKASYSIFIIHQVLIAMIRLFITSDITIGVFAVYLIVLAALSALSYLLIERKLAERLKNTGKKAYIRVFSICGVLLVITTAFSGWLYFRSGIVRDVPELDLYTDSVSKNAHSQYNSRVYDMTGEFVTDKQHWLVVGDSFARDFCNVILESDIADKVEISYSESSLPEKIEARVENADMVFVSQLIYKQTTMDNVGKVISETGSDARMILVGCKNFGVSNDIFYARRNDEDYLLSRVRVDEDYITENNAHREEYGESFLDIFALLLDDDMTVPVFTDNGKYISQDCEHLTKAGAEYLARLVDFGKYLK